MMTTERMIGETIEFDAPGIGKSTVKKSGKVLEDLGNGRLRVEILVGGEPTTMIVNPDAKKPEKKAKPGRKPKAKQEPQLTLFPVEDFARKLTSLQEDFEAQLGEIKALVSPAPDDALSGLEINNDTVLRPDYIHHNAEEVLGSKIPALRVFARPEIGGDRHYLYAIPSPDRNSANNWQIKKPLPGVTSILKKTMPTPPSLIKWQATFPGGYSAAKEYTELAASKGTIMHSVFADYVNDLIPELDSTEWHNYIALKIAKQKVDKKHHGEWQHFMKKALLSLMQWIEDYDVTILLMEIALVSETLGYAGQVDVICQMNKSKYTDKTPADKRERVNAIVDFKSGEHNADSHSVQLSLYIPLIQEAFPNFKIDQAWNWHPTDWRERPNKDGEWNFSYNAINQTGKLSLDHANLLLKLYNMDGRREVENVIQFVGKPQLGMKPTELIKSVGFVEHWESTFHLAMDLGLSL